jgi:hypothetical protein
MQRIGYFSIRGYWRAPLALFAITIVTVVALGGRQHLGAGLGLGVVYSSIIAFIWSMVASQNRVIIHGPNGLYKIVPNGPGFKAEITELMQKVGS